MTLIDAHTQQVHHKLITHTTHGNCNREADQQALKLSSTLLPNILHIFTQPITYQYEPIALSERSITHQSSLTQLGPDPQHAIITNSQVQHLAI